MARWTAANVVVGVRFGLLTVLSFLFMQMILFSLPFTIGLSAWYAGRSMIGTALVAGLLFYAFTIALGGPSLFKEFLGESEAEKQER